MRKHFTLWPPCLVLFDRVWSCLIKFEGHQITQNISFVLVFDVRCFVRWTAVSKRYQNMFVARMHTTLAKGLYP